MLYVFVYKYIYNKQTNNLNFLQEEKIKPKKTRSTDKTSEPPAKKTKKTIDDFFGGKKTDKSEEEEEEKKKEIQKDDSPDSDTEGWLDVSCC